MCILQNCLMIYLWDYIYPNGLSFCTNGVRLTAPGRHGKMGWSPPSPNTLVILTLFSLFLHPKHQWKHMTHLFITNLYSKNKYRISTPHFYRGYRLETLVVTLYHVSINVHHVTLTKAGHSDFKKLHILFCSSYTISQCVVKFSLQFWNPIAEVSSSIWSVLNSREVTEKLNLNLPVL